MPKVSVITRTKDRQLLLERAIKSVLSQSFEDWEHIIVNNSSKIDPAFDEMFEKYSIEYNGRFKIIKNETGIDFDPSISVGIEKATGEYIVIHDDDDSFNENFLTKTVDFLDKNPKFGAVETYLNYFIEEITDDGIKTHQKYPYRGLSEINIYNTFLYRTYSSTISTLYRKKCVEKIGKFNPTLLKSGDREFVLRFLKKYKIAVLKEPLANCHIRPYGQQAYANSTLGNNAHQDNVFWEIRLKEELFKHNLDLWLYYNRVEYIRPWVEKNSVAKVLKGCLGQKIALYGAGIRAEELFKNYKKEFEKMDIVAIFDQNQQKHGSFFEGHLICPPEKIMEFDPDKILIMVANVAMVKPFLEKLIFENHSDCEIVNF